MSPRALLLALALLAATSAAAQQSAVGMSNPAAPASAQPQRPQDAGGAQTRVAPSRAPAQAAAQPAADKPLDPLQLDARVIPLGGALRNPALWQAYKARFITDQGRVVDTANGMISHSEGQGYAMVVAVAANDRAAFEKIWGWTRANLMVRDDQLVAWRWEPNQRPAIADMNNASDGDLLIAWALAEAADFWGEQAYRIAGRRIAVEVGRKLILLKTKFGSLLLPGVSGFAGEDRKDGPVVNLSYWVFPALSRLPLVAPDVDWAGLTQSGLDLIKIARFGPSGLPTEWLSAAGGDVRPADGFAKTFGYNTIRIPLYLAWAGIGEREHYQSFANAWSTRGISVVDAQTGRSTESLSEGGYSDLVALTLCVTNGKPFTGEFFATRANENYYPATLHLLSMIAANMRYGSCLRS